MGAFFFAATRTGDPPELSPALVRSVRRCLNDRAPGTVTEGGMAAMLCFAAGHDASIVTRNGMLVLADGLPTQPSSSTSALPAIADQWASGAMPDLSDIDGSFALCCVRPGSGDALLVRDRFGSRPLVWHDRGDCIFAASEAKTLIAAGIKCHIDRDGLAEALAYRWMLGQSHLLAPIQQVPAAHVVILSPTQPPVTRRYWRIPFSPEPLDAGAMERFVDQTAVAMRESIRDVSTGGKRLAILLSGGVDSSIIAAIAQEVDHRCVAYVGRLANSSNIELDRAVEVAAHLGMECRIVDTTAPEREEEVRAMVHRLEELPRHPNNLVLDQLYRRMAGEADIVLHGDAAEMTFGLSDSRRVEAFRRKHEYARRVPGFARGMAGSVLRRFNDDRAQRLARVLDTDPTVFAATLDRITYDIRTMRCIPSALAPARETHLPYHHFDEYENVDDALQAFQADTFLIASLVRHDRLAQPYGLQPVSPFLAHRMLDVACRLPRELRYAEHSKPVLRALCDRYFPPHVSRWPKMGFEVPWHAWLARLNLRELEARSASQLLPRGFLRQALNSQDMEALWSALVLVQLVELFC